MEEASKKGDEQNKVNRREDRARAKQIIANAKEQIREQESQKRIRHDLELLDEVIQKGFRHVEQNESD